MHRSFRSLCKALRESVPLLEQYKDRLFTDTTKKDFCRQLYPVIFKKYDKKAMEALMLTVSPLKGKVSPKSIRGMINRCIDGDYLLKQGVPLQLWGGGFADATMKCTGVTGIPPKNGKRMLKVHLYCLQGEPCGLEFMVDLSTNLIETVMGKYLGLSFKKYNCPAEELTGCFFKCIVTEDTAGAHLSDYSANQDMKQLNRQLAEARLNPLKCKRGAAPCNSCPMNITQCPLAVWKT